MNPFIVNISGRNLRPLDFEDPGYQIVEIPVLACSADGDIAFSASGLYMVNGDGTNLQRKRLGFYDHLSWSPNGQQIAASGAYIDDGDQSGEIYLIDAVGSNITRLTHNEISDREPTWSPDGQQIAFSYSDNGVGGIAVMNTDGSQLIRITEGDSYPIQPAWSPDGERILFVAMQDGLRDLYTIKPDGSDLVRLTQTSGFNMYPLWSPNSEFILFSSDRAGLGRELYIMDADGGSPFRIVKNRFNADNIPFCWLPFDPQKLAE